MSGNGELALLQVENLFQDKPKVLTPNIMSIWASTHVKYQEKARKEQWHNLQLQNELVILALDASLNVQPYPTKQCNWKYVSHASFVPMQQRKQKD